METDFLKTLLQVAELGSMAEAARRLDLTPAAVAHQIRSLEKTLGAPLVVRAGRTVRPTRAGYRLLERARPLVSELAELQRAVRDTTLDGELRIGAITTALHTLLPDTLRRFTEQHPRVRITVQAGLSHQLLPMIQEDALDVAVCLHPQFELPKTLRWARLRDEPLVLLVPTRLAGADPLMLLHREPFIRYDRTLGGGRQADAYLRANGIVPQERFELSALLAIALMVEHGLGVALVPDIRSPLIAGLALAALPLPGHVPPRTFGLLWKRASTRAALAETFLGLAEVVAQELPAPHRAG